MIVLRPAVLGDAAQIAAIYAPHVLAGTVSFEIDAPDAAVMAGRMAGANGLYPWIVAIEDRTDAVLGYAYAGQFSPREAYRWVVETSIYVGAGAQRRGVGRRLYAALIATLTAQSFTQAIGRIAMPNAPSDALHAAIGFACVGVFRDVGYKHGEWIDVGYWQRGLAAAVVPPAEPVAFAMAGLVEP